MQAGGRRGRGVPLAALTDDDAVVRVNKSAAAVSYLISRRRKDAAHITNSRRLSANVAAQRESIHQLAAVFHNLTILHRKETFLAYPLSRSSFPPSIRIRHPVSLWARVRAILFHA